MTPEQPLKLKLQGAPLIMAIAALQSRVEVEINWPQSAELSELDFKLPRKLSDQLDWLHKAYKTLHRSDQKRAYAPHILPFTSKVDLNLSGHQANLGILASLLLELPLPYARTVGESLQKEIGQAGTANVDASTKGSLISDRNPVRITKSNPANELELGLNTFYRSAGMNWGQAFSAWLDLKYEDKVRLMTASIPTEIEQLHYELEIVSEPQLLLSMAHNSVWDIATIQPPVPAHGYELPKTGEGGMMQQCFDTSFELVAWAQKRQTAAKNIFCLWGHRQRALIHINSANFAHLIRSKSIATKLIMKKLSEKHPMIWEELGQSGPMRRENESRSPAGPGAKGRPGNHP